MNLADQPSTTDDRPPGSGWDRRVAARLPAPLRRAAGRVARPVRARRRGGPPSWVPAADPWAPLAAGGPRRCNICRWAGPAFDGPAHSEGAVCPRCGSIARDRFLFWALQRRVAPPTPDRRMRVLETSPRLDERYRSAMSGWFDYLCSDFDERAHAGAIRLDLQAIDLPSASVDVVLTPHVLEHVPDTAAALDELFRVIRPGGHLLLQVPLLQERTAPPAEPEFHGDRTPVFWRFGPELGDVLTAHGFEVALLVPRGLQAAAGGATADAAPPRPWPLPVSPEFDVEGLLRGLCTAAGVRPELTVVAEEADAVRHGFEPAYMFLTWDARRPASS
jgi:SAM-dependent methyltransferase